MYSFEYFLKVSDEVNTGSTDFEFVCTFVTLFLLFMLETNFSVILKHWFQEDRDWTLRYRDGDRKSVCITQRLSSFPRVILFIPGLRSELCGCTH